MTTEPRSYGGLVEVPDEHIREIVYGRVTSDDVAELRRFARVDEAHCLVLHESGLITAGVLRSLLAAVAELDSEDFDRLLGQIPQRGLYFHYEAGIDRICGADAGWLRLGKSRNDLNATCALLAHRERFVACFAAARHLLDVLVSGARDARRVVTPLFTHGRPAVLGTVGEYLAAVASDVLATLDELVAVAPALQTCPLGAAALAGSTVPIDSERRAELLGFSATARSHIAAIATRRAIRASGLHAGSLAQTCGRVASDLIAWTAPELALFRLDDRVVGSSSALPQKRNPFLLEHVKGEAAAAHGAISAGNAAEHAAPFTNHIAVHTHAVAGWERAVAHATRAATLVAAVLERATPDPERMAAVADASHVDAAARAERLSMRDRVPFRDAHDRVAASIDADDAGDIPAIDPDEVVTASGRAERLDALLVELEGRVTAHATTVDELSSTWAAAADELAALVRNASLANG